MTMRAAVLRLPRPFDGFRWGALWSYDTRRLGQHVDNRADLRAARWVSSTAVSVGICENSLEIAATVNPPYTPCRRPRRASPSLYVRFINRSHNQIRLRSPARTSRDPDWHLFSRRIFSAERRSYKFAPVPTDGISGLSDLYPHPGRRPRSSPFRILSGGLFGSAKSRTSKSNRSNDRTSNVGAVEPRIADDADQSGSRDSVFAPVTIDAAIYRTREDAGRSGIMTRIRYPEARRDESVVDEYHGVEIKDPYRWLEDPDSAETKAFVDAQNAITKPYLAAYKARDNIHERLKQLWDFPKYSCPAKHGEKYYFYKNTGLQNQSVLYVQDTLESEPRVFLDPNTFSEDGTVAITSSSFSEDGSIFAYGLSKSGSDWSTIHFLNAHTGENYPEILEKVKFSPITWTHDNRGIFYGQYRDQQGKTDGSETLGNQNQKLCYHVVDTPQSDDVVAVEFPEEPLWRIGAQVSDCGKWLIVTPLKDCRDNLVYFTPLKDGMEIKNNLPLTQVVDKLEADYEYVTNIGNKAVFRTNKGAPNYKLIAVDLLDYEQDKWVDLLPEHSENVLDWASAVDGDKFVACYIQDVKNILQLHCLNTGKVLRTFPLDLGTVLGFSGEKKYSEIFYQFTSFLTPGIIYTIDLKKEKEPRILREIKVKGFDASLYKTSQIFYPSKDGTKIPMFIVTKNDAVLDGSMPGLLYGYGGFNASIQPTFSVTRLVFIQHFNGVLAVANVRGGGEYGERWHNAGRFFNRQNVFDDFQYAAKYLVENGYTTSAKLTIQGGSNGGLAVAVCINQRPDLFGAAIAQVGVMDMLRFHKFTIGSAWVSDYGSSDDPKHFENLLKYSPLHNVKVPPGDIQYPAMLLLTADHDDRVVPLHTLKLTATLQYTLGNVSKQKNPLLARIDTKAGHGGGKPTMKVIEESTDILSFIAQSLGLEFKL